MAERLLAYVVTREPPPLLRPEPLIDRLREMMAPLGVEVGLRPVNLSPARALGEGFTLSIDNTAIMVLFARTRLPAEAYEPGLRLNRVWPDAQPAMAAGQGHVVLATIDEVITHGQALNGSGYLSFIAAALIEMIPSIGVMWTNGEALSEAQAFHAGALRLLERKIPALNWLGFWFLSAPPDAIGQPQMMMMTSGMRPFIGREVEWMPSSQPRTAVLDRLIGTCLYLIENGPVIKDGETLGKTHAERVRVRYAAQGQRSGVPVLQLGEETALAPPPGFEGSPWGASTQARPPSPWDQARTAPDLPPSWSEGAAPRAFGRKRD